MKIKGKRMTAVAAAGLLALTALAAAPAQAEDMEISTRGRTTVEVYEAIVRASERLCESQAIRGVHDAEDVRVCVSLTVEDAVSRSARPSLQRHHAFQLTDLDLDAEQAAPDRQD